MKLNPAGIKYISKVWEDFEEHLTKLSEAIRDKPTKIDLGDCVFGHIVFGHIHTIRWVTYLAGGELDDYGSIYITEDELCNMDYKAIREKYKKQAVKIEKDLARKLLKKYPEILIKKVT